MCTCLLLLLFGSLLVGFAHADLLLAAEEPQCERENGSNNDDAEGRVTEHEHQDDDDNQNVPRLNHGTQNRRSQYYSIQMGRGQKMK